MSEFSFRKITNFVAFIGIICCALSIVVGKWVPIFNDIAAIIAFFVTALCAFFFVKAKRSVVYMLLFVISLVILIVFKSWMMFA